MSWKVKGEFVWHILKRDFKRFSHSKNSDLSLLGNGLLEELDKVFVLNNNYKDKKINNVYFLAKIEQIKSKMLFWLRKIQLLPNADQARRVAENILKSFKMVWLFSKNREIDLTNNFAERQIKHHVKYRLQKLNPFALLTKSVTI